MSVYALLSCYLPPSAANVATGLWFALLLGLILLCAPNAIGFFRYQNF